MTKLQDTFGQWVTLAKHRAEIRLMDGREATLLAVRKPSRNCKIMLANRHYLIWIDDVALVRWPGSDFWVTLDAWPVVDLDTKPGVTVTPKKVAENSRNWLKVTPNPRALHPSFQPPASSPEPASSEPVEERHLWLVPKVAPPAMEAAPVE